MPKPPLLHLTLALLALFAGPAIAQPVAPESLPQGFLIVIQDKTGAATAESPIYLASNATGWNPGLASMKLAGRSDSRWQILIPQPANSAKLEFKLTRGGWDTVEIAADGSDIANRTLAPINAGALKPGEPPTIELTVEKWADQRPGAAPVITTDPTRPIKATGTIRRLQVVGGGPPTGAIRDLLVWLPPGYDNPVNAQRTYPVLYLMDGQNLFEKPPGVPAEWSADETATELIASNQVSPLIIVGVPHAGQLRTLEYLPIPNFQGNRTFGEPFVDWLIAEVMPRVQRTFRTKPGAENTAIGGASLGGLIGLFAGSRHPDTFGKVLAESPSLILGPGEAWKDLFKSTARWPSRVYIGMGAHEVADPTLAARLVEAAKGLDAAIKAAGLPDTQRLLVIEPGATHDESAWARRLPSALKFLFPPTR